MANKLLKELLELPRPQNLNKEELGFYSTQLNIHEPGSKEFENIKNELVKRGVKIPEDNYLGVVITNWYENFTETPKYEQSNQTETPQYEAQNQTTVNEKLDEPIFEEAEKRVASGKQARERAESDVKRGIEKQQQLYEERITRELKNKKVVVVPTEPIPTVKLTDQDKEVLFTVSQEAKKNPATSTEFFKSKITESLSQADAEYQENVTPAIVEKSAVSITENLRSLPDWKSPKDIPTEIPSMNPVSPVVAMTLLEDARLKGIITDEDARKKAVEMAQNFALGLESENIVNLAGAGAVFKKNKNIASALYGPVDGHITQFEIAENQEEQRDEGVEIDIESIYDNGKKFHDLWGKIRSGSTTTNEVVSTSLTYIPTYTTPASTAVATQTASTLTKALPVVGAVYGFRQGMLLQQWARSGSPLLSAGNQQMLKLLTSRAGIQEITSASMLNFSKPFVFQSGKLSLVFVTGANQTTGAQIAMGGAKFGEKWLGVVGAKSGSQAIVGTVAAQAGTKIAVGTSSFLTKALTFLGGLGSWATAGLSLVAGWILGKIIEKIDWTKVKKFFKEVLGPLLLVGGGMMFGAPVLGLAAGGLAFGLARGATLAGIGTGIWGFFARIGSAFVITIATPIIIALIVIPPLVAFIMLVINNSAYMIPPIPVGGSIIHIPPGGNLTTCDPNTTGEDITDRLAGSMQSGSVYLLPDSLTSRQEGICMDPTMIILHTSGGFDNDDGNTRTYETLVQNDLSCQIATDTNETILMLSFFERQVEYSWCANDLNNGGVSIEMAGECQGSGCAPVSKCSPGTDLTYTPNGPHPCAPLEDLAFSAICKVMQEYKIPWTQVFQHEASNGSHTDPIGDEWVDKFIIRLKDNCVVNMN